MQISAKEQSIIRIGFEVVKIVDGDGLIVRNMFHKSEEEIRLYGVDAPEIKLSQKLRQDERESHIPGSLVMTLGYESFAVLRNLVLPGTSVSIIQEVGNLTDKYGRTLAYIILPDGRSISEIMLENGYVKPYDKVFCSKLPEYQAIFLEAKSNRIGLFQVVSYF